jgi:hypothetical protein
MGSGKSAPRNFGKFIVESGLEIKPRDSFGKWRCRGETFLRRDICGRRRNAEKLKKILLVRTEIASLNIQ